MGNCLVMGAKKRWKPDEDLLPGIIDHIIMDNILPKLRWKDFYRLSSVSHAWNNAIRSRQVFDSRVLFNSSPDTVLGYYDDRTIVLYSIRENSWHTLPPITSNVRGGKPGVPAHGECVSMDGKIYVLGGSMDYWISEKVFVFDLAGGGKWKQCASLKQKRKHFGSALKDGKIYVFGGTGETSILNSEVYDPEKNTWSNIRPTTTPRNRHHVTQIGHALCIYGGLTDRTPADSSEAYHPFKDEWRVVHRPWNGPLPKNGVVVTLRGNVYSIQPDRTYANLRLMFLLIDKYDVRGNSWKRVHSFSFVALIPVEYQMILVWDLQTVLVVDDELIALLTCSSRELDRGLFVFQRTGFGSKKQKISWKLRAVTFEQRAGKFLSQRYFVQML